MNAYKFIAFSFAIVFFKALFAQNKNKELKFEEVKGDTLKIEVIKLSDVINSEYDDFAPVITADGSQMFFTSRRPYTEREKKKHSQSQEHIYVSEFDPDFKTWSKPEVLPDVINVPEINNSSIAISNDGHRLLLYQGFDEKQGDIFEAELKGKNWTKPVSLGAPINTTFHESSASIAPDGRTIYFVSERTGGSGGRDIWKCTKDKDGKWGKPENLGRVINTRFDEEAVLIHPDGRTLYFSSKGHNSMGGYDIYRSVFDGKKWSKPENLGTPINTKDDDLFFVIDASGTKAFYSSARDKGNKDIYQINFIRLKKETKSTEPRLTLLKGTVKDAVTKEPIEAKIEIIDNEKNEVIATFSSNSQTGRYLVSLPSGKNYGINVSAPGYLFHSENVELPDTATYNELVKNIFLNKAEVGSKVVLRNIFFDTGKATLRPQSVAELDRLKKILIDNPTIKIEISGHTDNVAGDEYNQKLSESRAKAVVEYLVTNGIANERLTYKGYGKTHPIASNDTEQGRQENRRVEFKILSK